MKKYFFSFFVFSLVAIFSPAFAQAKSYVYKNIDEDIQVQKDTTFTVSEKQTYRFEGEFHKGWRSIPLEKVDAIENITVTDGVTGTPLRYVSKQLDPLDPSSNGQYTFRKNSGNMEIEWYFNAKDETHTWILSYTVLGGLSFYTDHDELYWNVFTDYSVPVEKSQVTVTIPQTVSHDALRVTEYLSGGASSFSRIVNGNGAQAEASRMEPQAKFTIAFGWPKGVVDQKAYWISFLSVYKWYVFSVAVWMLTFVFCGVYWFFGEKFHKERGTIVAEYEPPEGLPPAMGEVIVKEKISRFTWPATIVDLAVRGFLKIEEEPPLYPWMDKFLRFAVFFVLIGVLVSFATAGVGNFFRNFDGFSIFIVCAVAFSFFFRMVRFFRSGKTFDAESKEYVLSLDREFYAKNIENLKEYEKGLVSALFSENEVRFSTRESKKDSMKARERHMRFMQLEKSFLEEVSGLGLYEEKKTVSRERTGKIILFSGLTVAFIVCMVFFDFESYAFVFFSLFGSVLLISYFLFFEARLNASGNVSREKWLGFKEYLYTAERYRMQDLTPDVFEKYLSYAMVFGVEKQWAKAFEGVVVSDPDWYGSSSISGSSSGFSAASFSASSFSSSLSSSIASSLGSSGAGGGASGGGGGAGGGGGGGGGGAS